MAPGLPKRIATRQEIGLFFALGVMVERKGSIVNWALFAVVVQVSGYKARKRPREDFVTISSLSISPVTTNTRERVKVLLIVHMV